MSHLEMRDLPGLGGGSFFKEAAKGWGPFTSLAIREEEKGKKAQAKIALEAKQQEFEREQERARVEREAAAVQALRKKVMDKIKEIETVALAMSTLLDKVRGTAADEILAGDSMLEAVDMELADLEETIVRIQVGTVADTASQDTHVLSVSYADAQAALLGLRSVQARLAAVGKRLDARKEELRLERIRAEDERQRMEDEAQRALMRQQSAQARQEAEQERQRTANERLERIDRMQASQNLDMEIAREKRALRQAYDRLEQARINAQRRASTSASDLRGLGFRVVRVGR